MRNKSWQQWSAVGAFVVFQTALMLMFLNKSSNAVFYSGLAIQTLCVAWVGLLLNRWPQGR